MGTSGNAHRPVGLVRRARDSHRCGLCGEESRLTKTHVPPQCAGNTGLVGRSTIVVHGGSAKRSRKLHGGLWVYGLCASCNLMQSVYDPSYCEFSKAMNPYWVKNRSTVLPRRIALPDDQIHPGSVARSILIGSFGVNPNLRRVYPDLAEQLLQRDKAILIPEDFQLRLAIARGGMARVTGAIGGYFAMGPRLNDEPIGCMTHALVYFPPLAWQVLPNRRSLLDLQDWADVSSWLAYDVNKQDTIRHLCSALPAVVHPLQHPVQWENWLELFSSETTEIVECDYLAGD